MRRSNALRVVTTMAGVQPGGDWSVRQFPREAMRKMNLARATFATSTDRDLTVASRMSRSHPQPAGASFLHFGPKPISDRAFGSDDCFVVGFKAEAATEVTFRRLAASREDEFSSAPSADLDKSKRRANRHPVAMLATHLVDACRDLCSLVRHLTVMVSEPCL